MDINKRLVNLVNEFNQFSDWEERYKHLIEKGKNLETFPSEFRTDKNLVKGCQSKAWLHAEIKNGTIFFHGDSEAAIVKGLISIVLEIYSNSTPDEILNTKPTFLEDMGLREHLSMSRANGLSSMLKQISLYALVFKSQLS